MLWELRDGAPVGFRELRDRCDAVSSSVLRVRLVELVDAALVEQDDDSAYALTRLGAALVEALGPLDPWARRWATTLTRPRRAPGSG